MEAVSSRPRDGEHCRAVSALMGRDTPGDWRHTFNASHYGDRKMQQNKTVVILLSVFVVLTLAILVLLVVETTRKEEPATPEELFAGQNDYTAEELKVYAVEHAHNYIAHELFVQEVTNSLIEQNADPDADVELSNWTLRRNLKNTVLANEKEVTVFRSGAIFTVKTWTTFAGSLKTDILIEIEYLGGDPGDVDNWRVLNEGKLD